MKFIFPIIVVLLLCVNCKQETDPSIKIAGNAQGTTYHITYIPGNKAIQ